MALPSTVYKARLNISDLDRGVYDDFSPVIARHPSENENRLLVRIIAYLLNADQRLVFGRGLSTDGDPALKIEDFGGNVELWIEVGAPDEKVLKKALSKTEKLKVYLYGERRLGPWKTNVLPKFAENPKVEIYEISDGTIDVLAPHLTRQLDWAVLIPEKNEVSVTIGEETLSFEVTRLN